MKKIIIGIATQEAIRDRARAIARGERKPTAGEPKIWFTSMRSLAEVLSDDNRALLKLIREQKPESLSQLAELSGRAPSNLSRTLKTMERYGLVEQRREQLDLFDDNAARRRARREALSATLDRLRERLGERCVRCAAACEAPQQRRAPPPSARAARDDKPAR